MLETDSQILKEENRNKSWAVALQNQAVRYNNTSKPFESKALLRHNGPPK